MLNTVKCTNITDRKKEDTKLANEAASNRAEEDMLPISKFRNINIHDKFRDHRTPFLYRKWRLHVLKNS